MARRVGNAIGRAAVLLFLVCVLEEAAGMVSMRGYIRVQDLLRGRYVRVKFDAKDTLQDVTQKAAIRLGLSPQAKVELQRADGLTATEADIEDSTQRKGCHRIFSLISRAQSPPSSSTDSRSRGEGTRRAVHSFTLETISDARPFIQLVHGFLNPAECDTIIRACQARLAKSLTVSGPLPGRHSKDRTSKTCYLEKSENAAVRHAEERVASLLRLPLSHVEQIQLTQYPPRASYPPHHDWFPPGHAETNHGYINTQNGQNVPNQRLATMFVYLSVPPPVHRDCAGGTVFPKCQDLEVLPLERGTAVLFLNLDSGGQEDMSSLHAGAMNRCKNGTYIKYGLNIWVRRFPEPSFGDTDRKYLTGRSSSCRCQPSADIRCSGGAKF